MKEKKNLFEQKKKEKKENENVVASNIKISQKIKTKG